MLGIAVQAPRPRIPAFGPVFSPAALGDVCQHRDDIGNQVINDSYFWDLSMQYAFTPRGIISLTIPFVYSTRSSLYEHDRVHRYSSSVEGIGDIQLMPAVWRWDPSKMPKGRGLSLGVGAH